MSRYYDDYIAHSWGSDPKSKKKEKDYNADYYQKHKLEILAKRAKDRGNKAIASAKKTVSSVVKDLGKVLENAVDISKAAFTKAANAIRGAINKNKSDSSKYVTKNKKPAKSHQMKLVKSKIKKTKPQKHKYLMKVNESGYTRYFYTQHEIDAYKANKAKDEKVLKKIPKKDPEYYAEVSMYMNSELVDGKSTLKERNGFGDTFYDLNDEDQETVLMQSYDAMATNPNYDTSKKYQGNCAYCTAAYDLRQRGYEVTADAKESDYQGSLDEMESWYEGGKFTYIQGFEQSNTNTAGIQVLQAISRNTEPGARGNVCLYWKQGGAHSLAFQVLPNGNTILLDCQSNKSYDQHNIGDLMQYVDYEKSGNIAFMRTDDLAVTPEVLSAVQGANVSETPKTLGSILKRKWGG